MSSRGAFGNWTTIAADAGDFDGDGRSDILWRLSGTVTNWLGQSTGSFAGNFGNAANSVELKWGFGAVGDFNGDGRSDIVWWTGPNSGIITDWLGTASGGFVGNYDQAATSAPPGWFLIGSGDFNGDGRSDLLWRDRQSGAITDWLGQADGSFVGNFQNAAASATKDWGFAGTGDFNGDGRADILWHDLDGTITEWLGTATGGFVDNPAGHIFAPLAYSVAGTGDFNGDGLTDILWQERDGTITDWLARPDGSFQGNFAVAATSMPISWEVAAIGDFDGDGRDDILWRKFDAVTAWYGQADGAFDAGHFQPIPLEFAWKVQPDPDLFGS